tara:strand:- start:1920 stop:2531 length:612 start_codon:yes stop_codon:yes gene_type:complete
MNIGRELNQIRENSNLGLFQNLGYQTERLQKKNITLDTDYLQGSKENILKNHGPIGPSAGQTSFRVSLDNPLRIDKTSEIYIDNVYIFNKGKTDLSSLNYIPFAIDFTSFPKVTSSNNSYLDGKTLLVLDDDIGSTKKVVTLKNKKLNYVTTINPMEISDIEFTLERLDHDTTSPTSVFSDGSGTTFDKTHLRIIIELVVITQ